MTQQVMESLTKDGRGQRLEVRLYWLEYELYTSTYRLSRELNLSGFVLRTRGLEEGS